VIKNKEDLRVLFWFLVLNNPMKIQRLSESIQHIEDLPVDRFIDVLQNMASMSAQEKLDGANIWVGVDDKGQLFTSREGKRANADRKYSPDGWALVSDNNQFRAAHAALALKAPVVKKVLQPGDTVEAEVLFGRQPNSVTYGAGGRSYIAFLRGVNGTSDEKAAELARVLANQQVEATVKIVDTSDGEEVDEVSSSFPFQFTSPQKVDAAKVKTEANLDGKLKDLEDFLHKSSDVQGMTNYQLMSMNLQQVPKEERGAVKTARADLIATVQVKYKLPIKQALLDKITVRSSLADDGEEGIGIEGIVLRDPETGDQFKIVDKDVFTTINKFNQHARQSVQAGLKTVDPDSPIESRGGLLGELRIKIAEVLGNRELAKASNVRRAMESFKGDTPEQTIKNFADSMTAIDDFQAVKKKVIALTMATATLLKEQLEQFKDNQEHYRLKLKTGKEVGLSPEVVKRTLLVFAEAKRNLTEFFEKIKATKSLAQFLAVMYGRQAKTLHQEQEQDLEEGLILEKAKQKVKHKKPVKKEPTITPKIGDVNLDTYKQNAFQILNSYIATVCVAMLIYHGEDKNGMRFLRDQPHMSLKSWSENMSPLNHWGFIVWHPTSRTVKRMLPDETIRALQKITKNFPSSTWRFMHRDLSYANSVEVKYSDHAATMHRLISLAGLRTDTLNSVLDGVVQWTTLGYDQKIKVMNSLYMYAMRFIPHSILFARLRNIQQNLLLNATGMNDQMVSENLLSEISKLVEDGDAAGSGDTAGGEGAYANPVNTTTTATTAAAIAPLPQRIGNKQIIRRQRNPQAVKKFTMKFPDTRKKEDIK